MRCERIRELLSSDYLDGELSRKNEEMVTRHLENCPACCRLKEDLLSQRMTFMKAGRQPVPNELWDNIRRAIVEERVAKEMNVKTGIFDALRGVLNIPKPAFAFAGVVTVMVLSMLLAGSLARRDDPAVLSGMPERLAVYNISGDNSDFIYDLGTNIEEIFLS